MKALIRTLSLLLLSLYFAPSANAGWACNAGYASAMKNECADTGTQPTPQAFITAYAKSVDKFKTSQNRTDYTPGECQKLSETTYYCKYSYMLFGTTKQEDSVGIVEVKDEQACPETLESRGENSSVVKSGDKYNVVWSVRQVADDICHNSCSYLASSASVSTCYRVAGSTDTGFCNFVVGLNSASPSCASESGYKAPATGDSLNPGTGTGGGGDDGGDSGTGGDGGSGGDGGTGGSGGDGDGDGSDGSSGDTEPDFVAPGKLNAKDVLEDEKNQLKYQQFVTTLESSFNDSGFGSAVNQLKQTLLNTGTGAACPTPVIELSFVTVVISSHCDIYNNSDLAAIFTTVFMAGWGLLSLRIVLSA